MGKIGDYVHYRASAYNQFGIAKQGNSPSIINISKHRKELESLVNSSKKSRFSTKEKNEITKAIEAFKKPPETLAETAKSASHKYIEEYAQKSFIDKLENAVLDIEHVAVANIDTSRSIGVLQKHTNKEGQKGQDMFLYLKSTVNKLDQIIKNFDQELRQDKQLTSVKKLKTQLNKLQKEFSTTIKKMNYKTGDYYEVPVLMGDNEQIADVYNKINELIQKYAAYPDLSSIEGTAFEQVIALTAEGVADLAEEKIDEIITNSVQGENVSTAVERYDVSKFKKSIVSKIGDNTFLTAKRSLRNKVDVEITWKDRDIKVSAKNYNFSNVNKTWITVIGGTSLLYMIQDLNTDLVNHYLNVAATHGRQKKNKYGNNVSTQIYKDVKKDVTDVVKQYIFYKGLTGQTYNRSATDIPDLVVINDKNSGKVKVLDIYDIGKKLLDNSNLKDFSVKVGGVNIGNAKLYNQYVPAKNASSAAHYKAAEVRIANLLARAHQAKVSAGFHGTLFY